MKGAARYVKPERSQVRLEVVDLDGQLPADHQARAVWDFVVSCDLSKFYGRVGSVEGQPGRPAADPAVVLALWLYATLRGVGSARHLARLSETDVAYRWLRGGVPVNYHGLAAFRVRHGDLLDEMLSASVAVLVAENLVTLDEIMVDGTKVKAAAGKGSLRSGETLAGLEASARARVAQLRARVEEDPSAEVRRKRAAEGRAAQDRQDRLEAARRKLGQLEAEKKQREKTHKKAEEEKKPPRVSTTDPQARMMRFADNGWRLGYNAQIAATTEEMVIVGVDLVDRRNDSGLARPMVDEVTRRTGRRPDRLLVDTTYATQDDIAALGDRDQPAPVTVFAPVPKTKQDAEPGAERERKSKRKKEPPAVVEWRERMATPEAKTTYKRRCRAETVNGVLKNRGLGVLPVRGLDKGRCVLLLHAIAHNLWRGFNLRRQAAERVSTAPVSA